jgi:hypothetical protein
MAELCTDGPPVAAVTVEIRRNEDGSVDEIVAKGCDVHIEQMTDRQWWMQIGNEVFWLTSHTPTELSHTETRDL